jgi:hypothetical protein
MVQGAFLFAALVNALPVVGVAGRARLAAMYGVAVDDPDLVLLLRHRALLFGIVAALLAAAAFDPALRPAAAAAGLASMVSFVGLAALGGPLSAPIRRIVVADVVATVVLAAGVLADR